ncbi:MAG: cobyrinate a,c-diamide synthase [Candidatus Omnitrophica bacterium]|nr:cobyrinate a,c-diamide synthase [Candidatus Omnitrophota bacterium]
MRIGRLLIAGTHSGVGKTTVTIGLLAALRGKGLRLQPFKLGPDYIDPGYHTGVAGRPSRNLDSWLIPPGDLIGIFQRNCAGADLALIEGVMGLYDGIGATGEEGSTAQLAKSLEIPVLLVLDASSFSRSAAALVRGYAGFDRRVKIAGCFLNRVAGPGHYRLVKEGIERLAGVPVVGYLPRDERLELPERHLGLVPSQEKRGWRRILAPLQARIREGVDLEALLRIARSAKPLKPTEDFRAPFKTFSHSRASGNLRGKADPRFREDDVLKMVPVGVAMDEAFHFYYPENLELLEACGGRVVPFSPLKDSRLPRGIGALYLGGGFPEVYASALGRNRPLHREIRRAVLAGMPTYAECGGLMFLSRAITDAKGKRHPMVGLLPARIRMTDRLQHFGYKQLRARRSSLFARPGEGARGHEFHHSVAEGLPDGATAAYEAASPHGGGSRAEGYARGNLVASYVHLHFFSNRRWMKRFVRAAQLWKGTQLVKGIVLPLAFFLLSFNMDPSPVAADEPTRLEEVVVTATKAKTPAKHVTRAVSVVSGERLGEVKGGFVSQALTDVPETFVRRSGSTGRATAVVIRGSSAPQVHVTLDGVHVASPTTGSFDFNHLSPDNLERVEILRGPSGTLYGSDAMGGVINLMTRRGEGPMRFSTTQEAGGQETFREAGSFQGAVGKWHLSGAASRTDSDGLSQNDDYQNMNLSTRIGYDLTGEAKVDLSLRHIFAIIGIDDGPFRPDPNRRDRERQTIGSGTFESPVTSWWSQTLKLSTQIGNLIDNDPSNGGTEKDSLFKLDTERYGAEWRNRFTPVRWDTVTVGADFEDREADNRSFSKTQTTRALYAQNQWRPIEPLTVVAGGRLFRESSFGSGQVFDASAAYFLAPWDLKIRGGWGQGFRVPTLNELFFPGFGNPNLVPEKSRTVEAGLDHVLFGDLISWSGTVFRTDFRDLIQTVRVSSTVSKPQNVGHARIDGVEGDLEIKPVKPLALNVSYTHLEANERPSGEELLRIPKNSVSFGLKATPTPKWEARLSGLLVSSREESVATNRREKTKGYIRLDFYGQYRATPHLKGYVRVENLGNRTYSEVLGFPASGTLVTVGVTVEQ